ncbi:MAG: hypothetical protein H6868_04970 [Rhodospirillales bacterium]|nr:hypothetical protein [Rhodospirillales bacterium]
MDKKKKLNVVVIFPVVVTVVLVCGLLYGVLQMAATPADGTDDTVTGVYERVEAEIPAALPDADHH